MNRRSTRIFTAVVMFLLLVLSLQPARASTTWIHSVVDNTATTTGKNLSVAVDPAGKLYLGYLDTTNSSVPILKYATNSGGSWSIEPLTNILPDASNISTATVFTPGGPRIMAYSYNTTTLKTMYRAARKVTGDGWQLQDIGGGISPLDGSIQPSMTAVNTSVQTGATQNMGFTYITYNDGQKLWYANEKDMKWYNISPYHTTAVAGDGGKQSDLVVDSSGNVHVIYVDALNNMYYVMNPTSPTSPGASKIQDASNSISNPSISIDGNNKIHVIYTVITNQNSSSKVYYISKPAGGSWSVTPTQLGTQIGVCGKNGGYTTLKVDGLNNVHAAWYSSYTGALMYNKLASGAWVYTTAGDQITYTGNNSGTYGQYAAMAIDQYNTVNIAYYDATSTSLDVVTMPNPAIDASPSPILFGYVPSYTSSAPQTVTIANKGTSTLTINTIGNPSLADFTVMSNGCTPLPKTLLAGASCGVSYQFAPTSIPGEQTATISIGSTDPNIPAKSVTLNGTATVPGSHTITAGPFGPGGTVSPAGPQPVANGLSKTFTFTPDPGYLVGMVMIDPHFVDPQHPTMEEMGAASKGALTSYTFDRTDLADHTLLVYFTPYVSVSAWSTTEVDNTSSAATGQNLSLAVDPSNNLYLGYLDTTSSTAPFLKYATNIGGSWSITSLKDILPNAMNASTATVYTPGGPRVMAYSYDSATLTYKYQAARKILGDGWQLQDIGGGINPITGGKEPTMGTIAANTQTGAVQYMGFTFITYNNGIPNAHDPDISTGIKYANERDMLWYDVSTTGTQSDLAVDSTGNIHVVYVDTVGNLMYAKNPKANGQATAIKAFSTKAFTNPSITVDANNTIHVIYLDPNADPLNGDPNGYNVKYTKLVSGGTWSDPKIVGPAGSYGNYLSIKADNTGGVHIAYYYGPSSGKGLLMYQHILPSGAWGSEEIIKDPDASANYGQYTAIAIDHDNIVNIAYYDATRTSLKVAKKQTFAIEASPSPLYFGNVAQGSNDEKTVTVTNNGTSGNLLIRGNVTISDNNASDFTITGNTCTSGLSIYPSSDTNPSHLKSCNITVKFSPGAAGSRTANLIIGSDDIMIPYKTVPLSGTSYTNTSYTITAGVMGVGGSITHTTPSGEAFGNATVVVGDSQTFTITPDPGYLVALVAIDPTGMTMPEIMAASKGALTSYTFNQVTEAGHSIYVMFTQAIPVTTWAVTEVDNTATNTGKYASITNDPNGKLYIGYLDTTSATVPLLKYATNRSGSWVYETVTTIPKVTTAGTAIVFSEGIGPRVMAYSYDSITGARKYGAARKWTETDNHWELQWIAGDFFPAQYGGGAQPSIFTTTPTTFTGATQFNGKTFISYTDGYNLWYANERDFYYYPFEQTPPGTWPTGPGSVAGGGSQSDLVLDSSGVIHIVYVNSAGYLRYGTGTGSSYTESTVISSVVSDPSITIDGLNTLHASYINSGHVYYINKPAGGSWSAPLDIGPCGANGAYTSIKANGLNIVHLTYYAYNSANASGKLMYITRSAAGVWSAAQAITDSSANFGQYAALTVDMHHNVNIAYYDVTRTSLKVAARQIPVISAPSAKDFGTIGLGGESFQTIAISNDGQYNLKIGTITIDGDNPSNFGIFANTCSYTTLAPNTGGCSVIVRFTAGTAGTYKANLHISSDDRYTPDHQVALTGTASGCEKVYITTSVNASAAAFCYIDPNGVYQMCKGDSKTFNFYMDTGFSITNVLVDSVPQPIADHYDLVNVQTDHTLHVDFASNIMVGGNYYGTFASAFVAANDVLPIKARALTFTELLSFALQKNIIFSGGFNDSGFINQNGATVIKGTLEIRDGGIEVQNIGMTP